MLKLFPFNMHFIERWVRVALGLIMLTYIAWGPLTSFAQTIHPNWGLLGIYPLMTGFWGCEPLYTLFGLNFRKKKLTLTEWDLAKAPRDAPSRARLDELHITPGPHSKEASVLS
jgi:hypothetical protein